MLKEEKKICLLSEEALKKQFCQKQLAKFQGLQLQTFFLTAKTHRTEKTDKNFE